MLSDAYHRPPRVVVAGVVPAVLLTPIAGVCSEHPAVQRKRAQVVVVVPQVPERRLLHIAHRRRRPADIGRSLRPFRLRVGHSGTRSGLLDVRRHGRQTPLHDALSDDVPVGDGGQELLGGADGPQSRLATLTRLAGRPCLV